MYLNETDDGNSCDKLVNFIILNVYCYSNINIKEYIIYLHLNIENNKFKENI